MLVIGLEPTTPSLRVKCTTNCATPACDHQDNINYIIIKLELQGVFKKNIWNDCRIIFRSYSKERKRSLTIEENVF